KLLDEQFTKLKKGATLPGETVFKLYDTYGFPADLTRVIAEERGYLVDEEGFTRSMDEQRNRADFASKEQAVTDTFKELDRQFGSSEFLGYETTEAKGKIVWAQVNGSEAQIVVDRTPFYGESGGQIGDAGVIESGDLRVVVSDTLKTPAG